MVKRKTSGILIAGIFLLVLGLGGCIGQEEEEERILTYTFWEVMAHWDPAITFDSTIAMAGECYETLVKYEQDMDPVFQPLLAESWSQSDDALTWTFNLQKDVKFHTDREMTAKDVKYSIDRTMEMDQGAAYMWIGVESVEVLDTNTVAIHTEYPMNIPLIASAAYGAYIIDSEEVQAQGDYDAQTTWFQQGNEVGTGPYYVHEWVETQQTVFKKFEDYWQGWDDKPNAFDTCIMKYVTEGSTLVQMLEGGEAQIIHDPPIDLIPRLEAAEGLTVQGFPSYWNMILQLNTKKAPTDELAVRQALSYAWDYEGVISEFWKGFASVAKGPVPEGYWGKPFELPSYSYNLEKAQQLLTDAGWIDADEDGIREKGGENLHIEVVCFEHPDIYRIIAEYWHSILTSIGVDVDLQIIPFDTAWSRAKVFETSPHVFMLDWWPLYITPNDVLYGMFHSAEIGGFNCGYYDDPDYDTLVEEGAKFEGSDIDKASQFYSDAQIKLINDAAAIFAWDRMDVFAYSESVTGLNFNPAYPMVMNLRDVEWVG